jgi:RNA recognition motif-containing protein
VLLGLAAAGAAKFRQWISCLTNTGEKSDKHAIGIRRIIGRVSALDRIYVNAHEVRMPVRLFVGNLPYDITEEELREFFSRVGPLAQVFIPVDRDTGKRRGFAFVEFEERSQAEEAVRQLNGQQLRSRAISVNEARPKEAGFRPAPGSFRPDSRPRVTAAFPPAETRFEAPPRRFGPDARPARSRKQSRKPVAEDKKKGPIRERRGGQLFGIEADDTYDEQEDWRLDSFSEEDTGKGEEQE